MRRLLNKEDDYTLGKKIFEQQYVGKYNPKTKLFKNKCGGLRNIYKERNLNELKYMKDVFAFPGEYKLKEWQYLYENENLNERTEEIYDNNILYTIIDKHRWKQVRRSGINSHNKSERTYVFYTIKECYKYAYNHRYDYRDWVVIKIDLKDKRSYVENDISTHYRFFDDPRSHDGIFTYENIDPQCLSLQKEFHLTDTDDFEYFK